MVWARGSSFCRSFLELQIARAGSCWGSGADASGSRNGSLVMLVLSLLCMAHDGQRSRQAAAIVTLDRGRSASSARYDFLEVPVCAATRSLHSARTIPGACPAGEPGVLVASPPVLPLAPLSRLLSPGPAQGIHVALWMPQW